MGTVAAADGRLEQQFGDDSQEAVMDAGMTLKSLLAVPGAQAQPRPDTVPAAPAILPVEKVVPPPAKSEPTRNEPRRHAPSAEKITHDVIIDPETREVVYRVLDARTRQVLHQEPDQASLRQQAYARTRAVCAMIEGKNPDVAAQIAAQNFNALT